MIKLTDDTKANQLYSQIKQIIIEKEKNSSYKYESSQYLAERDIDEEIKNQYLREEGKITFENINGDLVTAKISRWHHYKRWSRYGIYEVPSFTAEIYIGNQLIWNLTSYCRDSFKGECSEIEVSSLDIPLSILQEKQVPLQEQSNDEKDDLESNEINARETKILFDEIGNLFDRYEIAEQQKQALIFQREKDIENARKKIINSYSKKLTLNENSITSVKEELNTFERLLAKYSTFNLDLIGNILQQLISIVESEEYLYKQVNHNFKKRVHGVMDSWDEDVRTFANIIITTDKYMECYESSNKTKIDILVENGDALLLSEQNINAKKEKQITFFTLKDGHIESRVNFGKFDYIKDFVDNIIQYRFQNNMEKITEKDMLLFLQNYIMRHKGEIVKNYESKFDSKVLKLRPNNWY